MNILITTFGLTWPVLPELIGFTNPEVFDFYRNHPDVAEINYLRIRHDILPSDELWIIHTDSKQSCKAITKFEAWRLSLRMNMPVVRYFSYSGVSELGNEYECRAMSDLIFRTVLLATEKTRVGKLIISLTGGRKNMSADIQRASDIFGCSGVIHIADHIQGDSILKQLEPDQLLQPLPLEEAACLNPMVLYGYKSPHAIVHLDKTMVSGDFPIVEGCNPPSTDLLLSVDKRMSASNSLLLNNYRQRISITNQSSFYGLQILPPRVIQFMENEIIGTDPVKLQTDYQWLKSLPKAELHCHLGGILSPAEMIETARSMDQEIGMQERSNPAFAAWLNQIKKFIDNRDTKELRKFVNDSENNLRQLPFISEPYGIASFLSLFDNKVELLERLIYGDFLNPDNYFAIGILSYVKLGDLQGSGLLKHPKTLRKACEILIRKCAEQNIRYCEIRCSPENYSNPGFDSHQVVEVMHNVLSGQVNTLFRLIIIGTRHKKISLFVKHVKLALELSESQRFSDFFAGFDIAGNESVKTPADLKPELATLLHKCIHTTIHAGEEIEPENIWEAAYELNADRIGHGLTLEKNPALMKRFADRKIYLEMCPSSNFQIGGYRNFLLPATISAREYPLAKYFNSGIKVTVNTDNPGISKTDLSNELLLAAQMTKGGLSQWDILKIIRNGFKGSFLEQSVKKKLIIETESRIAEQCLELFK
jgi:adenosine deaminase